MAWGNFVLDIGFDASAAIVKFRAVKLVATNGSEAVAPIAAEGNEVVGVAQFGVTADEILKGKGASVRLMGVTEMEAGGAITRGDEVGIDAVGKAVTANTGSRIVGKAMTGCAADGDRVAVFLYGYKPVSA